MPVFEFERIVCSALRRAYEVHESLGEEGLEKIQKNQFGETALRADLACEEAVLGVLRAEKVPIRVVSEEHGTVDVMPNPVFLGVLDGLDGSNRYVAGRGKERYGTMFGVFSNLDPMFGDYLASGIMEHSTGKLFFAEKNHGACVISGGHREAAHASSVRIFDRCTRTYIDRAWETNRRAFSELLEEYPTSDPRAFATYFSDLMTGNADLALFCTRKGNLEPAIGYGLTVESGGIIMTVDGAQIGVEKYFEFGQEVQIPLIAASSEALGLEFVAFLKQD